tara:strand:- start:303 stop:587 length:285 start_codon:yes stop_codon:yes gene_type:complete
MEKMSKKEKKEFLKNYDDGSFIDERTGVKTYTIYNNDYILEQVLGLAKSYAQWCSWDAKEICEELRECWDRKKPGIIVKEFNEIFKDYCQLTFL